MCWSSICVKNICKYLTVLLLFHHQIRNLLHGMKIYMQTYQLGITIMKTFYEVIPPQYDILKEAGSTKRRCWGPAAQFPVVCQYWPICGRVTESNTDLNNIYEHETNLFIYVKLTYLDTEETQILAMTSTGENLEKTSGKHAIIVEHFRYLLSY